MDTLPAPTAREMYSHMSQGREIVRMVLIMALFVGAGICFIRPPWPQNGETINLALHAGLVVGLVCVGFWQINKHEIAEELAWRKAWLEKLDRAGFEIAMATLRQGNLDHTSVLLIREWMSKQIESKHH